MSQTPYIAPAFELSGFNCPHCNAYAKQDWFKSGLFYNNSNAKSIIPNFYTAMCCHCSKPSFWTQNKLIYPATVSAPKPNVDLPEELKEDYEEARSIAANSPRGAAALLRLVIQKICVHLGEPGKDLNKDIGSLVKKGLNPTIQKALDVVRVVGNNAVHPGSIDLNDTPEIANTLFHLVNVITDSMISQPKQIAQLYDSIIPDGQKQAIQKRDETS